MVANSDSNEAEKPTLAEIWEPGSIKLDVDEQIEIVSFGDLQEGDVLIGSNGRTKVVQGYDAHVPESMYVLETDSGIELEMSGNHLLYVVTSNDRDLHRKRLAEGKKLGKLISRESIETLEELVDDPKAEEALVAEFEHFIEPKSKAMSSALVRIAESLGPISEVQLYVDDLGGAEAPLYTATIHKYDRRLFAQQILSLLNIGKARRKWPPIVGSVVTAEMLTAYDPEDIYIPDPPEVL